MCMRAWLSLCTIIQQSRTLTALVSYMCKYKKKNSNFTINRDHTNNNKETRVITFTPADILVDI